MTEPRNPLYLLLLVVGVLFCVTALAYAVVPVLEEKARAAGAVPPPSEFRESLNKNGGTWLLVEVATLIVLGLASMAVDHFRRIRKESSAAKAEPPLNVRPTFGKVDQ
jgi:hypothetical protein